jgi:hypothetical protein|tara:strand:- start:1346 stop:1549 length:204 start_codon:yes stop_codon:yes gene_type:complete
MVELQKKLRQIKKIFGKEVLFRIGVTRKGKVEIISVDNIKTEFMRNDEEENEGTIEDKSSKNVSYIG